MLTNWKKSNFDWQENFDRCSFCNGLTDYYEIKDGLCPRCHEEVYELPETVRMDVGDEFNSFTYHELDRLFDLYYQE
jgi:hypothetical protein